MSLLTPDTISESHTFGNDEHKVGSKLAPSYQGKLISVSYNYEVRVWHHALQLDHCDWNAECTLRATDDESVESGYIKFK